MSNLRFGYLILLAFGLIVPFFVYPVLAMKVLCLALLACACNLLLGYTRLLSLGHAAFFGSAGYVAGHAIKVWGLPPELGVLTGTAASLLLGWGFGSLSIRRQGIYFAMITLALAQLIFFICLQTKFTGGEDGLQGVPRGTLFGFIDLADDINLYYFVLSIFSLAFWLIHRIIHSPFGQILKAIRENEARAISLGYDVTRYKLLVFVISAGLAGLAGATKVVVMSFASLSDVHWYLSGEAVLMTILGGMGTVLGPLVGAIMIVVLEHSLTGKVGSLVTVIIGVVFVVCVMTFRRGIVGEISALCKR